MPPYLIADPPCTRFENNFCSRRHEGLEKMNDNECMFVYFPQNTMGSVQFHVYKLTSSHRSRSGYTYIPFISCKEITKYIPSVCVANRKKMVNLRSGDRVTGP